MLLSEGIESQNFLNHRLEYLSCLLCSSYYYAHTFSHVSLCGSTQCLLDPVPQSPIFKIFLSDCSTTCLFNSVRVKSGILGQTASFGQSPCLFHSSIIGIKNKLTKQTVKILMRRLIGSRLIWIFLLQTCPNLHHARIYPTLPYNPSFVSFELIVFSERFVLST